MRLSSFVLFLATLAGGAIATTVPALAVNGTVTSLSVSQATVVTGSDVTITVHGTGTSGGYCEIAIQGIPGYPAPAGFQFPGYLVQGASTQPIPFPNPGTYKLTATGAGDCNGSASVTVTVTLASAPTGNITGATITPNPVAVSGELHLAVQGSGRCMVDIEGLPTISQSPQLLLTGETLPVASYTFTPLIAGTYDVYVHGVLNPPAATGYGPCTGGAHVPLTVSGTIPTIEKLRYLPVTSPARPDPAMLYAGDELKIETIGNIDNASSKGGLPYGCNYETDIIPDQPGEPGKSIGVNVGGTFGVGDIGPAPGPGSYHIVVKGTTVQGSPAPPCHGEASIPMYFWPKRAFINGLSLRGHGLRVGDNDVTNLIVIPNIGGSDPSGSCGYHIAYTVNGSTTQYEEIYHDGGPPEPSGAIPGVNANNVTFVVTISPATTAGVTPCQIFAPNSTISKKITFSANPILPEVIVN